MAEQNQTTFENRAIILADLWVTYRFDEEFQDFFEFADLGLPLAYAISNDIVKATPEAAKFIDETWDLLLAGLEVEDTGFETIGGLFDAQIDGQDE